MSGSEATDKKACQRVVLDAALSPVQSRVLTCAAGDLDTLVLATNMRCWLSENCLNAFLSPVQSRLLTCAAGVVDTPVSLVSSWESWCGWVVYIIACFTKCSCHKLLACANDV